MLPKKQNNFFYVYMAAILSIFALFFSWHLGYNRTLYLEKHDSEEVVLIDVLKDASSTIVSSPTCIFPLEQNYWHYTMILVGGVLIGVYVLYIDEKRNRHAKPETAQGSAHWNTDLDKYNKKYTDPPKVKTYDGKKNMILGEKIRLSMNTRQTFLNNNQLIVGGSGAGKTRYLIKPNLLQANCNFVITDPAGELLASTGHFLEEMGYEIKVFNLVEKTKSDCYNPFEYIRDEPGIMMLVNCLIQNTNGGKSGGDPFWEKSETALLMALISYLKYHRKKEEQNFANVMKLLRIATVDEENPNAQSKLDQIFEVIGKKNPNDIAYKNYMTFKMGAGKTLKSILISCAVRLNVFNMEQIENLTRIDTLNLKEMGDRKQALFVIIPAADDTFNFLVSMMYSQLFETLYFHAETECPKGFYTYDEKGNGSIFFQEEIEARDYISKHPGYTMKKGSNRLLHHVRFMLDEFANIGQIPAFEKKLATLRKYELSCTIILQNLAQLKNLYEKSNEDIIGNCDSFVFLGGKSFETLEYVSKMLGKTTIVIRNNSRSKGKSGSSSLSFNTTGRDLMNPNEISLIDGTCCIILIRGVDPFFDKKYDYTKHENYHLTGDANPDFIYVCTKDNSKKMTTQELEKMADEEKAKAMEKEPFGKTQTPEDYVKDHASGLRTEKRYKPEQPEETKNTSVLNSEKQQKQRSKEKQTVMDTLNRKGAGIKKPNTNIHDFKDKKEEEKEEKTDNEPIISIVVPDEESEKDDSDKLIDKLMSDIDKEDTKNAYDAKNDLGDIPDFSEHMEASAQIMAEDTARFAEKQKMIEERKREREEKKSYQNKPKSQKNNQKNNHQGQQQKPKPVKEASKPKQAPPVIVVEPEDEDADNAMKMGFDTMDQFDNMF